MRRREFIAGLGGAAAWPVVARGQQAAMPVVGFVSSLSPQELTFVMPAFHEGLKQMGYVEGRDIAIFTPAAKSMSYSPPPAAGTVDKMRSRRLSSELVRNLPERGAW
jgi:putative ABC transport system substrate-binding protein